MHIRSVIGLQALNMAIAQEIYEYSKALDKTGVDNADSDEIKKRIVDSIFVAYGAKDAVPIKLMQSALLPSQGPHNSPIYFSGQEASVETSAFINGSMTRYLDYNDTYLSKEALHPSDNIPPILSLSYALGSKGADAIKAIKVAYQVVCSLSDAVSIRDRGWDHVTYISISSAAGLGSLMGLENGRFVHALNLAINNNISLRQTRAGELSMWKGCTAANASRNSIFAALLAQKGLTGPAPIFEGEMEFLKQVSGAFDLNLAEDRVRKTMIKNYPVEYHAMSGVEAALELKGKVTGAIKEINVETFSVANKIIVYNLYNFAGGFVALNNVSSAQLIYGGNYTAFGLFGSAVSTAACTTQESNCTIQAESSTSNQCVTQVNCTNTYYYINVTSITKLP